MNKSLVSKCTALLSSCLLWAALGCGAQSDSAEAVAPPSKMKQPEIQEPDLYRQVGDRLYVQNAQTGLNILDISNASKPRLVGRAAVTGGAGAEIYVQARGAHKLALVLLKQATSSCQSPHNLQPSGWSFGAEVALVDVTLASHPRVHRRYCLPGKLVASRTVDRMLFVVTKGSGASRALSLDTTDPTQAKVVQQMSFSGDSKEIIVSPDAMFVASKHGSDRTQVRYISITSQGKMTARGVMELPGLPQGRFHMHRDNAVFYIVTYEAGARRSRLSVIDLSDPDNLGLHGEVPNIGRGEQLKATRFVEDRAYVVTFKQTDPLFVIDLSDHKNPRVVGELHIPGWSDFLFPMGKQLVAVGRGDNGMHLGVSLFDVSDAANPRALKQISLGGYSATSEANVDHRGVTILKRNGKNPVVVVPYTSVTDDGSCTVKDYLRLVEVLPTSLKVRGRVTQSGTIRRSLMVNDHLYSISDYEVLALDIRQLDNPMVDTAVTVGTSPDRSEAMNQYCGYYGHDDDMAYGGFPFMCAIPTAATSPTLPPASLVLLGLVLVLVAARRRRR